MLLTFTKTAKKVYILNILVLVLTSLSCQSTKDPYEKVEFKEIIVCQGLDSNGEPIEIVGPVTSNFDVIFLCIDIETPEAFFFSINWEGPALSTRAVLKATKSGWLITAIAPSRETFLPGDYKVRLVVLKTQKATKTFEVIQED